MTHTSFRTVQPSCLLVIQSCDNRRKEIQLSVNLLEEVIWQLHPWTAVHFMLLMYQTSSDKKGKKGIFSTNEVMYSMTYVYIRNSP